MPLRDAALGPMTDAQHAAFVDECERELIPLPPALRVRSMVRRIKTYNKYDQYGNKPYPLLAQTEYGLHVLAEEIARYNNSRSHLDDHGDADGAGADGA